MFDVANVNFNRADGTTAVGVANAIDENTRQQQVVFAQNGLNWTLPYTEFFAAVSNDSGERPANMPVDANGQPYRFSDGDRVWDPETDLGMKP